MDEGTFVGWLKQDGELVRAGEPLFTLEGDKAAQEVEATESGILRIPPAAPKAGDTVSVGALLGYLLAENEKLAPPEGLSQPVVAGAEPAPSRPAEEDLVPTAAVRAPGQAEAGPPTATVAISPRARRRATELGLDYRRLKGSGPAGRITEADVVAAAQEARGPGLSTMRRTIAQRTAGSYAKAPHFYLRTELDATALLELREHLLPEVERAAGVRLTLTDLLLRAQAVALRDCPSANAIWQDDQVVRCSGGDVGLVVGLEGGLLIPIVRGADAGSLAALAKQRAELVEAARAGRLTAEAMQGGATSLSNLGNTCVDEFAAVIAPPQSSMLAVGRAAPRPFVVNGQLALATTLKLCLSVDHRVMDGALAAKFLGRIVELIEHPEKLA
jgi:pyruvate dehydrogenase E2 component (dihydrolipoamide acetyltransferase)